MKKFLYGCTFTVAVASTLLSWALISQKFLVNGGYQIEMPAQADYASLLTKKGR